MNHIHILRIRVAIIKLRVISIDSGLGDKPRHISLLVGAEQCVL